MKIYMPENNTIVFSSLGEMHCGMLLKDKYNHIIINPIEYNNTKILDKICNQVDNFYLKELIDKNELVLHLNCENSGRINEFKKLYDLLNKRGFKRINFVNNNLNYNQLIEDLLREEKASLCLEMNYGQKLDYTSERNLRTYLDQSKIKENINVHCIIRDIYNANDKGILDFIKLMYKIGINKIGLRLDEKYLSPYINCVLPDYTKNLFINFFKTAKRYSFFIDVSNKRQNDFLKQLCKVKKKKTKSIVQKIKNKIFQCEDNDEI